MGVVWVFLTGGGGLNLQRRIEEAELHDNPTELRKQNFTAKFPMERNCGSRTLHRHSPKSRIAEANLREDIISRGKLQERNI